MGLRGYEGATPPWVVWNLLTRYTREGDLVVDPFCGGGTTLDVARSLNRRALGYDLNPVRPEIFRADARSLPLEDGKADFVFMDPPYSTHIEYSEDPRCIGKLSAFDPAYYEAFERVFDEADRVLRGQEEGLCADRDAPRRAAPRPFPADRPHRGRAREPRPREAELPQSRRGGQLLPARLHAPAPLQEGAQLSRSQRLQPSTSDQ